MNDPSWIGKTLDSINDRALLQVMGVGKRSERSEASLQRHGSESKGRRKQADTYNSIDYGEIFRDLPESQVHEKARDIMNESVTLRHVNREPEVVHEEKQAREHLNYKGAFIAVALKEDSSLGIETTFPPGRVFVIAVSHRYQCWAYHTGIEVGCEIIRVNGEFIEYVSPKEFRQAFRTRRLELTLLPPNRATPVFQVKVARDEYGDVGFRLTRNSLSILIVEPKRQPEFPLMQVSDLILGVNGHPVGNFEEYRRASRNLAAFTLILRRPSDYETLSPETGASFKVKAKRDSSQRLGFLVVGLPLSIAQIRPDSARRLHPMQKHDLILAVNDVPVVSYSRYEMATLCRDYFILTLRHAEAHEIGTNALGSTYTVDVFSHDRSTFGFHVDSPPLHIGQIESDWVNVLHPMRQRDLIVGVNGVQVATKAEYVELTYGLRGFTLTLQSIQFDVKVVRDMSGDEGFHIAHPPLSASHVKPNRAKSLHPMEVDDLILAVNGEPVSTMNGYRNLVSEKRVFVISLLRVEPELKRTRKREIGEQFNVTVEPNQFKDAGFSIRYPPLAIVNVQDFAVHPARSCDIILAVDGIAITSLEQYQESIFDLEEYTLTLRRPTRPELVSLNSFDVEIFCDADGSTGFELAHPPLSFAKLSDDFKILYTIREGDLILAVNGTPVSFPSEYERKVYNRDSFILKVVKLERLGGVAKPEDAISMAGEGQSEDVLHVKVKRDAQGRLGYQIDPASLLVSHVENLDEVFPMKLGDLVCSVNGSLVASYDEYRYMTECLDVFSLTLRDPASMKSDFDMQVTIIGAKNFAHAQETCKLFCVCQIQGFAGSKFKTPLTREEQNPVWNYTKLLPACPVGATTLEFCLFRQDNEGSELLGESILQFSQFHPDGFDGELALEDSFVDNLALLVNVKILAEKAPIRVTIIGARDLRDADIFGSSDAFCICEVRGKKELTFETYVEEDTLEPTWNHMYEIMDFCAGDILDFTVLDADVGKTTDMLGWISVPWEKFSSEDIEEELKLEDSGPGADSSLTIRLEHIVAVHLEVSMLSACEMRRTDIIGGADPFCICEVLDPYRESTRLRCQTPVVKDTLTPTWNFSYAFTDFPPSGLLKFSLRDKDAIGSDSLGTAILANETFLPRGFEGSLTLQNKQAKSASLHIKVQRILARAKATRRKSKPRVKSVPRSLANPEHDAYRACYSERGFETSAIEHGKPWQSQEAGRALSCSTSALTLEQTRDRVAYNISTGGKLTQGRCVELQAFDIRYTSDEIENRFYDGSELFIESLQRFPTLKVAVYNGIHYALNNQHLYVLKTVQPHAMVRAELAHAPWIAKWPPSTTNYGARVHIKQEATLQHVCFGNGPSEWLVVSRLKSGKQQFRQEGIPEEFADCLKKLHSDGFEISVVGMGDRSQWFVAGQCIDKRGLQMFWGGVPKDFATDLKSCRGKIIGVSFVRDGWLMQAEYNSVWRNVTDEVEKLLNSIYGSRRHSTSSALGPGGEYFMASASDTATGDHEMHWGGMGMEFDNAMKGDVECVSLGGANLFVVWSCDNTTSWGVHHRLLNCPEFN